MQQVWPLIRDKRPDCRLWIVGNAPTEEILHLAKKDKRIEVSGRIEDIREAFDGAHILLAPVFSGKGTRYKILEAMAAGTPIIATSVAVEGLGVINKRQVVIADDAQTMSEAALQLLDDVKLQQRLSENGKKFVQKHYDWELIAKKLNMIYQSLGRTQDGKKNT